MSTYVRFTRLYVFLVTLEAGYQNTAAPAFLIPKQHTTTLLPFIVLTIVAMMQY